MPNASRPLRVFLCHSSNDKEIVREIYQNLLIKTWVEPWLDEEKILPGADWNLEIEKAIESSDLILVCISKNSVDKEGYVQREIRIALDYANNKPEGALYIIPIRLEECEVPRSLQRWQYVDYFENQRRHGRQKLLTSLQNRAKSLGILPEEIKSQSENILSAQEWNEKGKRFFEEKKFDSAISAYNNAINLEPESAKFYFYRGGTFFSKKDYTSTVIDLETAIKLDPNYANSYYILGVTYVILKDMDKAMKYFTEAIQKDSSISGAYTQRAFLYIEKNDFDKAIKDSTESIRLNPSDADSYACRGKAYALKHDYPKALSDLNEAIRLNPNTGWFYAIRGAAYLGNGDIFRSAKDVAKSKTLKE